MVYLHLTKEKYSMGLSSYKTCSSKAMQISELFQASCSGDHPAILMYALYAHTYPIKSNLRHKICIQSGFVDLNLRIVINS